MLFNSTAFLFFFPLAVGLYFATPHRARWAVLLAASYLFYGWWRVEYLGLILASTLVDYVAGLRMGRHATRLGRRPWLALSLLTNVGLLATFKYLGFFVDTVSAVTGFIQVDGRLDIPSLLLPVGISFYTFQTLAYAIDVYRGQQEPERHLGLFALYVSFWPQLVAGPIERSQHLLPQFRERHRFDPARVADGLLRMAWGLFKKVVIADRLAIYVQAVYGDPAQADAATVLLATYLFGVQVYCDFSGYTDIAIGAARVMGFDLSENFRQPFRSRSLSEFWTRWHITLMSWFRDYLYIPLGGNRVPRWRWMINIGVVFLVSGLWHGAAWTFVLFGAAHGVYVIVGVLTHDRRAAAWARVAETLSTWAPARGPRWAAHLHEGVSMVVTFHLVIASFLLFRAGSLADAWTLLSAPLDLAGLRLSDLKGPFSPHQWLLAAAAVGTLVAVEWVERTPSLQTRLLAVPPTLRHAAVAAFLLSIVMFGEFGATTFVYFQF